MPADPVLVVVHEATRSGSVLVALEVVRAARREGRPTTVVLRAGGPLRRDFDQVADRVVVEPLRRLRVLLRRLPWTRRLAVHLERSVARRLVRRQRPALLFANTVLTAPYVPVAAAAGLPTVFYVHEGDPLATRVLGRYRLADAVATTRLLACSAATAANLARVLDVDVGGIEVVEPPTDVRRIERLAGDDRPWPAGSARVVGACGAASAGKGVDQWLEMVSILARDVPDVEAVWIGHAGAEWRDRARAMGLSDRVRFVGEQANPYPWLAALDVMTLPSRTDQWPLVVGEAMALHRPVVAFDVGGVRERLDGTGVVVAAGDVQAMAAAVATLLHDPERREQMGRRAAARARADQSTERFAAAMAGLLGNGAPP